MMYSESSARMGDRAYSPSVAHLYCMSPIGESDWPRMHYYDDQSFVTILITRIGLHVLINAKLPCQMCNPEGMNGVTSRHVQGSSHCKSYSYRNLHFIQTRITFIHHYYHKLFTLHCYMAEDIIKYTTHGAISVVHRYCFTPVCFNTRCIPSMIYIFTICIYVVCGLCNHYPDDRQVDTFTNLTPRTCMSAVGRRQAYLDSILIHSFGDVNYTESETWKPMRQDYTSWPSSQLFLLSGTAIDSIWYISFFTVVAVELNVCHLFLRPSACSAGTTMWPSRILPIVSPLATGPTITLNGRWLTWTPKLS